MADFVFEAWNIKGEKVEGRRNARSSQELVTSLRRESLTVASILEMDQNETAKSSSIFSRRITSSELESFSWQLSLMIDGGVPITTALEVIANESENIAFGQIIFEMSQAISDGDSFYEAMSRYPKIFNSLARSMVNAGESCGSLPKVLTQLAAYYEKRDKMIKKIRGAMAYPCFAMGFITLIVIAVMTFIIPRFKNIFEQMEIPLPAFTQAFMNFYDLVVANLVFILVGVFLFVTSAIIFSKIDSGKRFYSRLILKIPIIGKIVLNAFVARFSRTFSILSASGVSVIESMEIMVGMTANTVMRDAISEVRSGIVDGKSISISMQDGAFFPGVATQMTKIGEETGTLIQVHDKVGLYYEKKVENLIAVLISFIEPAMIVVAGGIVSVIIIAMYLPIFNMTQQ